MTSYVTAVTETKNGHIDQEQIIARLEEAGRTLLSMRLARVGPSATVVMGFDVVHDFADQVGWGARQAPPLCPAIPGAAAISAMEEAFGWLSLIPDGRFVVRRIVGARAMVHPMTERHLYGWRELARYLGADYRAVQRWHATGIKNISEGLFKRIKRL